MADRLVGGQSFVFEPGCVAVASICWEDGHINDTGNQWIGEGWTLKATQTTSYGKVSVYSKSLSGAEATLLNNGGSLPLVTPYNGGDASTQKVSGYIVCRNGGTGVTASVSAEANGYTNPQGSFTQQAASIHHAFGFDQDSANTATFAPPYNATTAQVGVQQISSIFVGDATDPTQESLPYTVTSSKGVMIAKIKISF